ncbi:MAG: hypothetical protein IPP46_04160 [Bacteroidetes bacterium]|nr:hypothetical protein [Bacteroidota bacterium]
MFWNNNDDFDEASFDDEVNDEARSEIKKEHERIYSLPVMIKANQIFDLVHALVETFKEEDDLVVHYREIMFCDAGILGAKIAGAESGDIYTLRMENAVQIKLAARNLLVQTSGLRMLGISEPHYLQLLRDEIEEFRLFFVDWVNSFDKTKDIPDDWGLFYDH